MSETRGWSPAGSSCHGKEPKAHSMDMDKDEDLFDAAAHWTLRLRDAPDAATRAEHAGWLAAGPDRAQAMAEAEQLLGLMTIATGPTAVRPRRARPTTSPRRRAWAIPAAAAAACAVLALGGLAAFGLHDANRLAAPIGEVRRAVLADGSAVTLNTGAVLDIRYGPEGRKVRLVRGEAFFDVVHDPARPFVVESRAGSAWVLGTAFDVRLQDGAARVSVLRGAVRVEPADGGGGGAVVRAGQEAVIGAGPSQPRALEDRAAVDAWRQRRLVVYRRPLSEVVAEIGRYRHGRVFVKGQALAGKRVSGVFDVGEPDSAIDALAATLDLKIARLGGFVLLY